MNGKRAKLLRRIAKQEAELLQLSPDRVYKLAKQAFKELKGGRNAGV